MGIRQWLGIGGSSDGTGTGTFSHWKVFNGVGYVLSTTSDALLTSIKTAVERVATEVAVGDGLNVRQATPAKLNVTEASAATIASRLLDGASSAASILSAIKTAVELIDDAVFTQDAAAGKGLATGAELVDPAALPADGVAGKVRRLIANLKGMLIVTLGTALSGENGLTGSSGRIWTQVPGTGGTVLTDTGTLYAAGCRVLGFLVTTTTVATAEGTFKDGGAGGTDKAKHFFNALGTLYYPAFGLTVGTDLYFTKGTAWVGSIVAVVDPAV